MSFEEDPLALRQLQEQRFQMSEEMVDIQAEVMDRVLTPVSDKLEVFKTGSPFNTVDQFTESIAEEVKKNPTRPIIEVVGAEPVQGKLTFMLEEFARLRELLSDFALEEGYKLIFYFISWGDAFPVIPSRGSAQDIESWRELSRIQAVEAERVMERAVLNTLKGYEHHPMNILGSLYTPQFKRIMPRYESKGVIRVIGIEGLPNTGWGFGNGEVAGLPRGNDFFRKLATHSKEFEDVDYIDYWTSLAASPLVWERNLEDRRRQHEGQKLGSVMDKKALFERSGKRLHYTDESQIDELAEDGAPADNILGIIEDVNELLSALKEKGIIKVPDVVDVHKKRRGRLKWGEMPYQVDFSSREDLDNKLLRQLAVGGLLNPAIFKLLGVERERSIHLYNAGRAKTAEIYLGNLIRPVKEMTNWESIF